LRIRPKAKRDHLPVFISRSNSKAPGDKTEDILDAYPNISKDDIAACLLFAAETIKNEVIYSKAS
jgi:hypothetical protein